MRYGNNMSYVNDISYVNNMRYVNNMSYVFRLYELCELHEYFSESLKTTWNGLIFIFKKFEIFLLTYKEGKPKLYKQKNWEKIHKNYAKIFYFMKIHKILKGTK